MQDYTDYQELHLHKGTENYHVTTIFNKDNSIDEVFLDIKDVGIIAYGNDVKKDKHERVRINVNGGVVSYGPIYNVLKDGTLWFNSEYNNWIINGDKTRHKYLDPLTPEEKINAEKWFRKFRKLYNNAETVYLDYSDYYIKENNEKWYYIKAFHKAKELGIDIKKQYPEKYLHPRMIELKDLTPDFFSAPSRERTRGFIELRGYQETEREEGKGLNPIVGSAGYYLINVIMPKGDTIKIKNYGVMYPNLKTYKILKEYGGRDDIIFMVQTPNKSNFPEKQGGMYLIKPRKVDE